MSLPRHVSGNVNPLKKYTPNSVRAPLVVSVRETLPCNDADNEEESEKDEDVEDRACEQDDSSSSLPSPVSMSAFLEQCQRPMTNEEDDDDNEIEDEPLPPELEAHFLAYPYDASSSSTALDTCDVPVLLMAEDERLPVLMSSLLYQRRVWHIEEPLVGIGFGTYDTVIRIYLGWLDKEIASGCTLVST